MAENQANRGDRDASDPFVIIERLTPAPVAAVNGMRTAYLSAFRRTAGLGSGELALRAWYAWRSSLLSGSGVRTAERRAEDVASASASIRLHVPPVARLWISSGQVRAAARYASRTAASSRG